MGLVNRLRQTLKIIKQFKLTVFCVSTLLISSQCLAGPKYYATQLNYVGYSDLLRDSEDPENPLEPEINFSFDARLYRIIILQFHGGQSFDGERSNFGVGFKFDLPGVFMLSPSTQDLVRRRKKRGINTSFYYKKSFVKFKDRDDANVADVFGFSADTFLTQSYYINWDIGLYSLEGNQYFLYSAGLGYEF